MPWQRLQKNLPRVYKMVDYRGGSGGHVVCGGKGGGAVKAKPAQRQGGCKVGAGNGRQVF